MLNHWKIQNQLLKTRVSSTFLYKGSNHYDWCISIIYPFINIYINIFNEEILDIKQVNIANDLINPTTTTSSSKKNIQKYLTLISLWSKNILRNKYDSKIFNLAIPALLTLAADPLLSIIDTIYVGRLGSNELVTRNFFFWLFHKK